METSRPVAGRTLLDVLDATVQAYPDAPAVDDGTVLTYADLARRVAEVREQLRSAGIGTGDRVGVRMPSGSAEIYLAILGILAAGAAYVPVDPDDPDDRVAVVWEDAGVCGVLEAGLVLRSSPIAPVGGEGRPGPDDDAWIIFTSGTTGRPKGVAVTHRSAAAFADAEAGLFVADRPVGPGDRVLAGFSVAFDASCEEMWLAWRNGACLVPAPRMLVRSGAELCPWLAGRGITVVSTVPTLAGLWPADGLPGVRLLIFGGEACPPELVRRFAGPGREVWNTYGPTEATVVACAWRMIPDEPVRIGHPLDGWTVTVVGAEGSPVGEGEVGELVIGGVGVARYVDPANEVGRFGLDHAGERVFRSGDLVRDEPAGLRFVGRNDEQLKIRGNRVEPGEIVVVLMTHPAVRQAHVAAIDGRLVAYVVTTESAELRGFLATRLPAAMLPDDFVFLDSLPMTTSGKIDARALPAPRRPAVLDIDASAPLEEVVTAVWSEVLGAPVTGLDDSFFELGGHSLSVAQVRERLAAVLGRPIATVDLFAYPTARQLASHLRGDGESTAPATDAPVKDRLRRRRNRVRPSDNP
ncbi:AMP-binding protein [Kribbella italica]|uniref:Amino acid adenylation domain-containing protein n=1 Tax=Kribbella italica TaxID=1540520 RepID=A0A7W9J5U5_9ACTN|nr:AMP-binding protein [Kribbella italica]MBB5835647.1 amino acid adenylation domain-containing protein [Kribbella italica]